MPITTVVELLRSVPARNKNERGFTLPEMLVVVVILGILAAIAMPAWWSVVEGRKEDSAANQLASDMRLVHNKAINRLNSWQVLLISDSSNYQIGPEGGPLETRSLCGDGGCVGNDPEISISGVGDGGTVTVTFDPDGSASVTPSGAPAKFKVAVDGNSGHDIRLTPATSGVRIDP